MGILKIIQGADYSANHVGKYDFITGIFRRKVVGGLERNYMNNNRYSLRSYSPISLIQSDVYTIKFSFFKVNTPIISTIFSLCDYVNGRLINFSLELNSSTTSRVVMKQWKRTTESPDVCSSRECGLYLGTLVDETEYTFEVDFNYSDLSFVNCKFNGVATPLSPIGSVVTGVAGVFSTGQTNTVSFGANAISTDAQIGASSSTAVGYTKPSFIQLKTADKTILHFDFLGDTYTEKLTDKANGIVVVSRGANVPFVSVPITI